MPSRSLFARVSGLLFALLMGAAIVWVWHYKGKPELKQGPHSLHIVATQSIVADWVRQIAGQRVYLTTLVGPDGNVHHFEPTPQNAVALTRAELVFEIGSGLEEPWLTTLFRASASSAKRTTLSFGLPLLKAGVPIDPKTFKQSGRQGSNKACCCRSKQRPAALMASPKDEADPHAWLDVGCAKLMVRALYEALVLADPKGKNLYEANWNRYRKTLDDLDAEICQKVATIPESSRALVTYHDGLRYFACAYGFLYLGHASGPTPLSEGSAGYLAHLIEQIKEHAITTLFPEVGENPVLLEQLARETGAQLAKPITIGALSPELPTYVDLMRALADGIVEGLKG